MGALRGLVLVCGVVWLALRGLGLVPEAPAVNEPALPFFDLAWIQAREESLWWAHARATLNAALHFAFLAWLVLGPRRCFLARLDRLALWKQHVAVVVLVALARVALGGAATLVIHCAHALAQPSATAAAAGAAEFAASLGQAVGRALRNGLEATSGWLVDGLAALTLLVRWPRGGVIALCVFSACSFALPDVVAVFAPREAAAPPPPALIEVVERLGVAPGELIVVEGDGEPATENIGAGRRIAVPRAYLARATPREVAASVAHEAGHVLARDNEWDWVGGVARAVLLAGLQGLVVSLFGRRLVGLPASALWPLLLLVRLSTDAACTVGGNFVSQRQELRADGVAVDAVGLDAFTAEFVRVTRALENDPALGWGPARWHSHPDLVTRLAHAQRRAAASSPGDADR